MGWGPLTKGPYYRDNSFLPTPSSFPEEGHVLWEVARSKFFEILLLGYHWALAPDQWFLDFSWELRNQDGSVAFKSAKEKAGYGLQAGLSLLEG